MSEHLLHLASSSDAAALESSHHYEADSLHTEGFIHCCTNSQLPGVVQRYYRDAQTLILLSIDVDKLKPTLVYENTVGGDELFPHVYGAINADAIVRQQTLGRPEIESLLRS